MMRRRDFLEISAVAMPAIWHCRHLPVLDGRLLAPDGIFSLRDPHAKALAFIALDAARSAGAIYADVRLTYTKSRGFADGGRGKSLRVALALSVRALSGGFWGWAATPYLAETEARRVGQEAVLLAQANSRGALPRQVEWGTVPVMNNGIWTTPYTIDPFDIAMEEIADFLGGTERYTADYTQIRGDPLMIGIKHTLYFEKQERVFASTEGGFLLQTIYCTSYGFVTATMQHGINVILPLAQGGWDYIQDAQVRSRIEQSLDRDEHGKTARLPHKNILDIGRYDIVCTANTVATLLNATLAPATQLDRALGYEANADGTSYLGPEPLERLGTVIASPLVNVVADRSTPRGLATVRWDDDGVVPEDFPLVKDGTLVDYQTTREQAAWLAPWYQKQGTPIRSHGCAASPDALFVPMQHTPNLTLRPGTASLDLEDLIASIDHGLLIDGVDVRMDFQCLNGLGLIGGEHGRIYEIRHGKRVAEFNTQYVEMALQFRAIDLWKAVRAIGGATSLQTLAVGASEKGEPSQSCRYSLATVPILITQQTIVDPARKA